MKNYVFIIILAFVCYYLFFYHDDSARLTNTKNYNKEHKADDGPVLQSKDILDPPLSNQPRNIKTH